MGIQVIIFGMGTPNSLLAALEGKAGTRFLPQKSTLTARNRWLGSGGRASGRLCIDAGAAKALRARKSLLAVGVTDVIGDFEAGEIIDIYDAEDQPVAVARARENARYISENLSKQNFEVAHANDIVLL
jgi:glutamate 5-kinase